MKNEKVAQAAGKPGILDQVKGFVTNPENQQRIGGGLAGAATLGGAAYMLTPKKAKRIAALLGLLAGGVAGAKYGPDVVEFAKKHNPFGAKAPAAGGAPAGGAPAGGDPNDVAPSAAESEAAAAELKKQQAKTGK